MGDRTAALCTTRDNQKVCFEIADIEWLLCRSALRLVDRSRNLEPMGEDVMDDCPLRDGDAGGIFGIVGDEAHGFLLVGNDPVAEYIDLADAERNRLLDILISGV